MRLNAEGAAGITVELSDERFALLSDHSGTASGVVHGDDGLDCTVTWPKRRLSALGGRRVRIRVHLKKRNGIEPRLYAIYLKSD
jgi:hypothetical protein